jgi:hypothetical protein
MTICPFFPARLLTAFLCAAALLRAMLCPTPAVAQEEPPLTIVTPLTLTPPMPDAGQPVTARFSVRNDGIAAVALDRIGVGGRGPGCANFRCTNYKDFPLLPAVTIAPGETYTYEQRRAFVTAGAHFFQISYQTPAGGWRMLGERVRAAVGRGLEFTRSLTLTPSGSRSNLVLAVFEVTNAGTSPIRLRRLGVALRGPGCPLNNWGCTRRPDYPFAVNVTLDPGESFAFRSWRLLQEPGRYFAQVSVQDATGVWDRIGVRINYTVTPPNAAP